MGQISEENGHNIDDLPRTGQLGQPEEASPGRDGERHICSCDEKYPAVAGQMMRMHERNPGKQGRVNEAPTDSGEAGCVIQRANGDRSGQTGSSALPDPSRTARVYGLSESIGSCEAQREPRNGIDVFATSKSIVGSPDQKMDQ